MPNYTEPPTMHGQSIGDQRRSRAQRGTAWAALVLVVAVGSPSCESRTPVHGWDTIWTAQLPREFAASGGVVSRDGMVAIWSRLREEVLVIDIRDGHSRTFEVEAPLGVAFEESGGAHGSTRVEILAGHPLTLYDVEPGSTSLRESHAVTTPVQFRPLRATNLNGTWYVLGRSSDGDYTLHRLGNWELGPALFRGLPGVAPDEWNAFQVATVGAEVVVADAGEPFLSFFIDHDGSVRVRDPRDHPGFAARVSGETGAMERWMALPPALSGSQNLQFFADLYSPRRLMLAYDSLGVPRQIYETTDPLTVVAGTGDGSRVLAFRRDQGIQALVLEVARNGS